jgi:hypothetical protein
MRISFSTTALRSYFTRARKWPPPTVLRICSESPLALHSITSETIDSRFASRTGNQRTAAMPNFPAYLTAARVGVHSLGSRSYRQQWWAFRILASRPRSHYAGGAKLVSVCSGGFILAETGLVAGRSVSTHRVCAEALAKRFPEIYVDTKQRIIDDGDRSGSRYRRPHSMPRGDKPCPTAYRPC